MVELLLGIGDENSNVADLVRSLGFLQHALNGTAPPDQTDKRSNNVTYTGLTAQSDCVDFKKYPGLAQMTADLAKSPDEFNY